jgi:hypothetical protein
MRNRAGLYRRGRSPGRGSAAAVLGSLAGIGAPALVGIGGAGLAFVGVAALRGSRPEV